MFGAVLLAGCAGMVQRPAPPELTLAGIRGVELRERDAKLAMRFEVRNPNDFDLEVKSVDFRVALEGVEVATGATARPFTLPKNGRSTVDVDLAATFERFAKASRAIAEKRLDRIRYEIAGTVVLADASVVPFRRSGEVPSPSARSLGLPAR